MPLSFHEKLWRGLEYILDQQFLSLRVPPFNIRGGRVFVAEKLCILTRLGSAFFQNSTTCLSCLYRKYRAKIIYLQQSLLEIIHFKNTLAAPPPWNLNGAHLMLW